MLWLWRCHIVCEIIYFFSFFYLGRCHRALAAATQADSAHAWQAPTTKKEFFTKQFFSVARGRSYKPSAPRTAVSCVVLLFEKFLILVEYFRVALGAHTMLLVVTFRIALAYWAQIRLGGEWNTLAYFAEPSPPRPKSFAPLGREGRRWVSANYFQCLFVKKDHLVGDFG
jgi:hypothetical protein